MSTKREIAEAVFGERYSSAKHYVDILASRGVDWGLIGPRETDRLWERHLFNSAALAGFLPAGASVVDVGSGAGLPGLPLALARPDLQVTLLEPLLRRFTFLQGVVADLGLDDRVRVIRGRAEEHEGDYDLVVARAVASLPKLIGWCASLISSDGELLALKGATAAEELAAARVTLGRARLAGEVLTARCHPLAEPTWVIRVRRRSPGDAIG